ncbi:hypothetical protein KJ909_01170 [Patescibacteria group bacterium]|nr:hypothetical protein [Patescibacteria group bacterium]
MDANRSDLNNLGKKPPYLLLSFLFLALTGTLLFFFLKIYTPFSAKTPPATPTSAILPPIPTIESRPSYDLEPPPSSFPLPTSIPTLTPVATPTHLSFSSSEDAFSLQYSLDYSLSQDETSSGRRYAFYSQEASITVHVGDTWSWSHPGRQFSPEFQVNGVDAFRYDINLQTIVDVEKDGRKYTVQCVHNGKDEPKADCETLLSSFRFL